MSVSAEKSDHRTEERRANFLQALYQLEQRREESSFELPMIAQEASYRDPIFGLKLGIMTHLDAIFRRRQPDALTKRRERAYLGRFGQAALIMDQLRVEGFVETQEIAPILIEGESFYGWNPNEDGKLYKLADMRKPALAESSVA